MELVSKASAQDAAIDAATKVGDNVLHFGGPVAYILLIVAGTFFISTVGLGFLLYREKEKQTDLTGMLHTLEEIAEALNKAQLVIASFQGNLRTDLKDMFSGVSSIAETVHSLIIKMTEAHGRHETQLVRLVDRIDGLTEKHRR